MSIRPRITAVLTLAFLTLLACGSELEPTGQGKRILVGGAQPLPECPALAQDALAPDCRSVASLTDYLALMSPRLDAIVVADVTLKPEALDAAESTQACKQDDSFVGAFFQNRLLLSNLEYLNSDAEFTVSGAIIADPCWTGEPVRCGAPDNGLWYVNPGRNLLLLARECCFETLDPGLMRVWDIFPVDQEAAFDWDGKAVSLASIRDALAPAPSRDPSGPLGRPCVEGTITTWVPRPAP